MQFIEASSFSLLYFMLLCLFVILFLIMNFTKANRLLGGPLSRSKAFTGGLIFYIALLQVIVKSGFVQEQPMPRIFLLFLFINGVTLTAAFSSIGKTFADGLPLWQLLGLQAFRLPLELVLHQWAKEGTIPETMTWTGQNFDVITGVVVLIILLFFRENKKAIWVGNIIGFALLLNVMRVAVMSSPLPFAWALEHPLQLAFHLPYALILPVCVGGALFGHIVLTRALMKKVQLK